MRVEEQLDPRIYPGLDGIPFRSHRPSVPMYRRDDPEHKKPQVTADMHVDQFDLSQQDQLLKLQATLDMCAKGRAHLSQMEKVYDEQTKSWRVLVIWGEFFLEDPEERKNVSGQTTFS